jgi:hypothetical protein
VERLNFHWLGHFGNRHDKDFALVSLHCRVHVREMVELVFRDDRTLALIVVVNGQRPLGTHYKFPLVASQDSSFFVRNYGFSLPDILNFGGGGVLRSFHIPYSFGQFETLSASARKFIRFS